MDRFLRYALVGVLSLVACSDDDDNDKGGPNPEPFSMEIEVVDDGGAPVEGVHVQLDARVEGYPPSGKKKAAGTVRVALPTESNLRVSVEDLAGDEVAVLADGLFAAGYHEFQWNGRNSGDEIIVGVITFAFKMVARDTAGGDILFQGEAHGVLATSHDIEQQPLLGITDADGKVTTDDRSLFPTLQEQPMMSHYDPQGVEGDPIVFDNSVYIVVRNEGASVGQYELHELEDGANSLQIVWTDPTRKRQRSRMAGSSLGVADTPTDIPTEFSIGPVYPNPFN